MGWVFAKPSALLQVVGGDMMAPTALKGPRFSSKQNCVCAMHIVHVCVYCIVLSVMLAVVGKPLYSRYTKLQSGR